MKKQRFIEVKEAPLDDPANLKHKHPDSSIRAFSTVSPIVAMGMVLLGSVAGYFRP